MESKINMEGLKQEILTMQRCKRAKVTPTILWPLVLYHLIQIAANLILTFNHPQDNLATSHYHHQHNNIINSNNNNEFIGQDFGREFTSLVSESLESSQNKYGCISTNSCSSTKQISASAQKANPLLSYYSSSSQAAIHYLSSLLQKFTQQQNNGRTIFGGRVLMASATSLYHEQQQNSDQDNNNKELIINLNSTNFNEELIQYKHPFPHIKLVEYYLTYCGVCVKFKANYTKLAREIHPWQNVIRPSAIDLAVSSNSPISHSWNITEVPTLRIHPPPNQLLAERLHKQLTSFSSTLSPRELQKSMYQEFSSSNLMVHPISMSGFYKDNKCPSCAIKSELLLYIERYVRQKPLHELPSTWPNLQPVTETNLIELRQNHPRQELFLIIEGASNQDADPSLSTPSLGLSIMLEMSSTAAWRAIRYFKASENKQLLEDVISQQKKASDQETNQIVGQQLKLLQDLISDQPTEGKSILLVHIDGSHSPMKSFSSLTSFPVINVVTETDLIKVEKSVSIDKRAKRSSNVGQATRKVRSLFSSKSNSDLMSNERLVELFSLYIKHTYTETDEDREFVSAINNYDENSKTQQDLQDTKITLDRYEEQANKQPNNYTVQYDQSFTDKISNFFDRQVGERKQKISSPTTGSDSCSIDYGETLKALRYMLFNEVPRMSLIDKSLVEQQEKLNTLLSLVTVIKSYFPFADASSIQFIDGVQSYLMKQQSRLSSVKTQESETIVGFDTQAFKRELKRLESDGKRLPEIKEWKHCSGYPCGLWRLFHTLTAFEYKKLSQLRQPPPSLPVALTGLQQSESNNNNNNSPSTSVAEAITMKSTNLIGLSSPVERLVSPPSTTTSRSLTIVTSNSSQAQSDNTAGSRNNNIDSTITNNNFNKQPLAEADLPTPVLLVMRDYVTTFFSCSECANKFRVETADLSLERIRQQEPAEFSILWLWEIHNRVNKRLSVDPDSNPPERPKVWFPTYDQCASCYNKPPSFLKDTTTDAVTIFHESIDWNKQEILSFLLREYSKQPLDNHLNLFGNQVVLGSKFIIVICLFSLLLIVVLRCAACYIERQRRHKATLLNGNGAHYSLELH